jgi:hypothetical protein
MEKLETRRLRFMVSCMLVCTMVFPAILAGHSSGFVGVSAEYQDDGTVVAGQQYGFGLHGNLDHRMLLGDVAFLGLSAYGRVYYDVADQSFSDLSAVDVQGTWFVGRDTLEFGLGTAQSFAGYEDSGSSFTPSWHVTYRFDRGYRVCNPFFSYGGSYDSSVLSNGLSVGVSYAPSVELAYEAAVGGALEHDPEAVRPDVLATLSFGVEGLSGYFFSWHVYGEATYRDAAAESATGFLGHLSGSFRFAPASTYQIQIGPRFDWEYLEGFEADVDIAVRADVSTTERVYWYVEAIAGVEGVQDSASVSWNARIVAGIDLSF